METAVTFKAMVRPGGRLELTDSRLPVGARVRVTVTLPSSSGPSILDVLNAASGRLAFHSAGEVDAYIREERDAWER